MGTWKLTLIVMLVSAVRIFWEKVIHLSPSWTQPAWATRAGLLHHLVLFKNLPLLSDSMLLMTQVMNILHIYWVFWGQRKSTRKLNVMPASAVGKKLWHKVIKRRQRVNKLKQAAEIAAVAEPCHSSSASLVQNDADCYVSSVVCFCCSAFAAIATLRGG